jgi:hypothetical protein
MPSLLTQHYRSLLGETFLSKLQYWEVLEEGIANGAVDSTLATAFSTVAPASVLYMFVGRPQAWTVEGTPPTPEESIQETSFEVYRDMLGAKRCWTANMNFVVARTDWVTGTIYDQYDDAATDMATRTFYVLDKTNTPYAVYKCLWNNDGGVSTISPGSVVATNVEAKSLEDGYTWQFMFEVDPADKFLTADWIPVYVTEAVQDAAIAAPGTLPIEVPLVIVSSGAYYNPAIAITVTLTGDGSGAAVESTVESSGTTIQGGRVTSIRLKSGGENYSEVPTINVYQAGATSAVVRAIIPPYPNHGYDPITELGAKHLMVITRFTENEGGKLTVTNDYRRVGLLINPIDANTGAIAGEDFYRQTWDIVLSANTGVFVADNFVYNTSRESEPGGTVVDVVQNITSDWVVRLTNVNVAGEATPFTIGQTIKCPTSGVEGTVNTVSTPEMTAYSGDVLYVNQRAAITREHDKFEEFKIILPFGG